MSQLELLSGRSRVKSLFSRPLSINSKLMFTSLQEKGSRTPLPDVAPEMIVFTPPKDVVPKIVTPEKTNDCPPIPPAREKTPSKEDILTRNDLFRIYLLIQKELLVEAKARNQSLRGFHQTEIDDVDAVLTTLVVSDVEFTDEDFEDTSEMGQLGILKKLRNKIRATITKVVERKTTKIAAKIKKLPPKTQKKIVKAAKANQKIINVASKAAKGAWKAAKKTLTFRTRATITAVLGAFKKKAATFFVYAFIKDNDPILNKNPKVAQKRKRAKNFLGLLTKGAQFDQGFLMKHIRNNMWKAHKKTPEQIIRLISQNKQSQLDGLGIVPADPATGTAGLVTLLSSIATLAVTVPPILKAFGKKDIPDSSDFETPLSKDSSITKDPVKTNGNGFVKQAGDFIKSPAGIITSIGVAGILIFGGVRLFRKRKKRR